MMHAEQITTRFIENIENIQPSFECRNATYDNIETPPKERPQFLRAIAIIREYEQDWDGNESPAPHPKALDTAETFISKLPWQREFPIAIYPGTDRSVVLEWEKRETGKLLLTIDPHHIGAVLILNNGMIEDVGDYSLLPNNFLSTELQNIIPRT